MNITFSKVEKHSPYLRTIKVLVDGIQVGELLRQPMKAGSGWYSHESGVYLPDGRIAGLAATDYGPVVSRAKQFASAYIRGMLVGQSEAAGSTWSVWRETDTCMEASTTVLTTTHAFMAVRGMGLCEESDKIGFRAAVDSLIDGNTVEYGGWMARRNEK